MHTKTKLKVEIKDIITIYLNVKLLTCKLIFQLFS